MLFDALVGKLQNCSSSMERQDLIRTATRQHVFTCQQLGVILMSLKYAEERRLVANILSQSIVDPENAAYDLRPFLCCESGALRTEIIQIISSGVSRK